MLFKASSLTLRFYLFLVITLIFLLFGLLTTGAILSINYYYLYQTNIQKGSKYAESLAHLTLEYLLIKDFATLEKFYQRLFSDPSIEEIALIKERICLLNLSREKEGIAFKLFVPCESISQGKKFFYKETKEKLLFYAPILDPLGNNLGWIKLGVSKRETKELLLTLIGISLTSLVIFLILAVLLVYSFLSRPLNTLQNLENFAKDLSKNIGRTISLSCKIKEFKSLEDALNFASKHLEKYLSELSAEKEKLFVTLLSIGDAVIVTDEKGRVILMNKIAEDMTGFSFEEVKERPVKEFLKFVSELTGEEVSDPVSVVLVEGKRKELANHTLLVRKDGEMLNIEDSASPIFSQDGTLLGVVFVFRDVTEKVRTQRELMRLEKMNLVNQLAGGIAHDLNNFLAGMQNYLYLAYLYERNPERVREFLNKIESLIEKAGHLTRRLLDLSKGAPLIREVISLREFLYEVTNFVFVGTPIKVCIDIREGVMNLLGDPAQLFEVFQNLLINARDVLGSEGRVEIGAENVNGFVKISISDNGPGIPREILPRIFEPFFTTKKEGTGLGLFVVKNLVENHGGKIEVFSEEGKGTTFVLYLPGTKEELKREEKAVLPLEDLARGMKVLVVDDEPEIRESLKEILEFFGFSVETAENGDKALEEFKASLEKVNPYQLVITDFTMPGSLSGPELAKELKKLSSEVKIIGASGYIQSPEDFMEFHGYFEGILPKPFNIVTLREKLTQILSSS
jgi:PAS domain S-box-containing protein